MAKLLDKLERIEAMYQKEKYVPDFFWDILKQQRTELEGLKEKFGEDIISPLDF